MLRIQLDKALKALNPLKKVFLYAFLRKCRIWNIQSQFDDTDDCCYRSIINISEKCFSPLILEIE